MNDDLHSVNLAIDEAKRLLGQLEPEVRHSTLAGIGAMAFGMLRAIAECPYCPGVFRYPINPEQTLWRCPQCSNVWHWDMNAPRAESKTETNKPRRRRKRKGDAGCTADPG